MGLRLLRAVGWLVGMACALLALLMAYGVER